VLARIRLEIFIYLQEHFDFNYAFICTYLILPTNISINLMT